MSWPSMFLVAACITCTNAPSLHGSCCCTTNTHVHQSSEGNQSTAPKQQLQSSWDLHFLFPSTTMHSGLCLVWLKFDSAQEHWWECCRRAKVNSHMMSANDWYSTIGRKKQWGSGNWNITTSFFKGIHGKLAEPIKTKLVCNLYIANL